MVSTFNYYLYFYYVIDIYNKYAWVIPLKDKKRIKIVNVFQRILNESNSKPNKIWVYKGSKFYYRSMILFLHNHDIETNSTHNRGKSVIAQKFIRTLKKTYKYMTSISKIAYIDELGETVNKYYNTYSTIKVKPVDVKKTNMLTLV